MEWRSDVRVVENVEEWMADCAVISTTDVFATVFDIDIISVLGGLVQLGMLHSTFCFFCLGDGSAWRRQCHR